jgi:hypothetical protein
MDFILVLSKGSEAVKKRKKKKTTIMKRLLSIEENKISVLIIAFVLTLGIYLYTYLTSDVINESIVDIINNLALSIGAINIGSYISNGILNRDGESLENLENTDEEPKG